MTDTAETLAEIKERMQKVDSLQWAMGYYTEADDLDPQAQADMRCLIDQVERLRAALEEIADVAHPEDMRSVNIARRALGRT